MEVLCIIFARGGSTRIPRKNIKPLNGIPLIGYAINTAKESKLINRIIVSTEDDEIANVAKSFGAEVPFKRPIELTKDSATAHGIINHALDYLKRESYKPDVIVLLYCTSPLTNFLSIDEGIMKLQNHDSVISVCKARLQYLWKPVKGRISPYFDKRINSQDYDLLYRENGAFYVIRPDILEYGITGKNVGFVIMDELESIDIDEESDFIIAELLIKRKSNN